MTEKAHPQKLRQPTRIFHRHPERSASGSVRTTIPTLPNHMPASLMKLGQNNHKVLLLNGNRSGTCHQIPPELFVPSIISSRVGPDAGCFAFLSALVGDSSPPANAPLASGIPAGKIASRGGPESRLATRCYMLTRGCFAGTPSVLTYRGR